MRVAVGFVTVPGLSSALVRAGSTAVRTGAVLVDRVRPPAPGVVILIYHRVGARSTSAVDLPRGAFSEQMAWLAQRGAAVSIDDAVRILAGDLPAPEGVDHPVVVTFDDGTADWSEEVAPVLVEHGVPATFYVATDFVESGLSFPDDGAPATWSGLADLVATGLATIGTHTHTHRVLGNASAAETEEELRRSIGLVHDRLQVPCRHFCYPKAVPGSIEAEAVVRRRCDTATLAGSRVNRTGEVDWHRLWRVPIKRSDTLEWFSRKATGGLQLEGAVRERLASVRYAGRRT